MRPSRETIGERSLTHGMSSTRLYSVWCGIKDRCNNPHVQHYDRYGGRGIKVCEEWNESFEKFAEWAFAAGYDVGKSGKEQSLDRVDVSGDYEPNNCRWISMREQARNREDTVQVAFKNGSTATAREFAELHGISEYTFVYRRAKKGISGEEILKEWEFLKSVPAEYCRIDEACELYGVSEVTLRKRVLKGKINALKYGNKLFIQKPKS